MDPLFDLLLFTLVLLSFAYPSFFYTKNLPSERE
jgi:hypothetical protein